MPIEGGVSGSWSDGIIDMSLSEQYPTWEIKGELLPGEKSLEEFEEVLVKKGL